MKLVAKESRQNLEDPRMWVGGEASLSLQAEDHVRRREKSGDGFPMILLGLAFGSGFALGSVACYLWKYKR